MKTTAIILLCALLPAWGICQSTLSMDKVETRRELSMSQVNGRTSDGMYRYYEKGSSTPYTGVLTASYDNGQILAWQEYVDGIGQGKWINYYENGEYKEIGYFEQNRVEGPIQKFHSNGQLQAEGTYKDWRIKINVWKYYDEAGQLIATRDYGEKGSIEEVQEYYDRGDISYRWYKQILADNGF
ncbi:MAG: hypothetical protein AAFV95_15420 [Bacteroidota bacterium]